MSDQTPIKGWECPDCDHVCDVDEIATLTARCEALEKQRDTFAVLVSEGARIEAHRDELGMALAEEITAHENDRDNDALTIVMLKREVVSLTARCEALEQEKATLHDNVHKHLGIALSDDGNEAFLDGSGVFPLQDVFVLPAAVAHHGKELRELRVRCEALTAERDRLERLGKMCGEAADAANLKNIDLRSRCQHLEQENTQLRAAQQAERDRFDRDLQNYSSGYTQALDDALKGKP